MKTLHAVTLALVLATVTTSIASAHPAAQRAERRAAAQHARIRDGVQRGELTRGESSRLRAGQRHVRRLERRALADGVLTRPEQRRIERAQDVQSRRIARLKHNARGRA